MSNKPISRKKNTVNGKGTINRRGSGLNSDKPTNKESGGILKNILNKVLNNEGNDENEK